jgi:cytochrome oxidase assembly protein ShyY1
MVIFKPNNPTFLEGLGMGNFGIFNGHLEYLVVIWYIFGHLVKFFPLLVLRSKKNLATLDH